jgi:hypothetical protein
LSIIVRDIGFFEKISSFQRSATPVEGAQLAANPTAQC